MLVFRRPSAIAVALLALLLVMTGCTLAGANPAPLTPVAPGEVPTFEPLEPEAEEPAAEVPGEIATPTQLAPIDAIGTQTATAPIGEEMPGEGENAEPGAEATAPPAEEEAPAPTEAPIAEATQPPAAGQCPTTYTVQQGDTLFRIAQAHGVSVDAIVAASNLANPDRLSLGQQLTIPCPGDAGTGAPPAAQPGTGGETVYTVQAGDNLFRIALRYGLTVDELARYNNIADPASIKVGQQIRIPQR